MSTTNSINIVATSGAPLTAYNEFVSFTPTVSGTTVAGAGTYTTQAGRYTRIGNLIHITCNIVWTAHTGTGNLILTALPFTVRNQASYTPLASVNTISVAWPAGADGIVGQFTLNTTSMALIVMRDNNTNLSIAMDTAGTLQVSGYYIT